MIYGVGFHVLWSYINSAPIDAVAPRLDVLVFHYFWAYTEMMSIIG
jgi:hypothetical protein